MPTILLAIDDTPEALEAARRAHYLFGSEATYLAVNVASVQPDRMAAPMAWGAVYPYPYSAGVDDADEAVEPGARQREQAQQTARAVAAEAGVAADTVGEVGDPTTAILAAADEHGADVIVTGVSDKSWWRRLLDHSVSKEIVREASVPVLVVSSHPRTPS